MATLLPSYAELRLDAYQNLRSYLAALKRPPGGRPRRLDEGPPWFEQGAVVECDAAIYHLNRRHFTRRYHQGHTLVVGERGGPLRLFWKLRRKHFAREMSDAEAERFRELSERTRR